MDAPARFAELVTLGDALPLDEAALLISATARPGSVDVDAQLGRLDALADACRERTLEGLLYELFVVEGFAGDADRYDHPDNSFVDRVLDRRRGIPVSLSLLVMEVGRRIGVAVEGVNTPGHFLARHGSQVFDPFNRGRLLEPQECTLILQDHANPPSKVDVLRRMLTNLRALYAAAAAPHDLAWVLHLRAALPGATPADVRELARAQSALARYDQAADTLERLDDERATRRAAELRARLN